MLGVGLERCQLKDAVASKPEKLDTSGFNYSLPFSFVYLLEFHLHPILFFTNGNNAT